MSEEEVGPMEYVSSERTLRLSSDQLKSLHLNYGSNDAIFSITTKFQVNSL